MIQLVVWWMTGILRDPRLREAFTHAWDQNESSQLAHISLNDSMYRLQLQMGTSQ